MAGLLEGALAKAIFAGFKGRLLKGELRREVAASAPDEYGDVITTPQYFSVEGFTDLYSAFYRDRAQIPETDLKVSIFAQSSPGLRPTKGDKVSFKNVWYQLRQVGVDPADALWECQAFEVRPPSDLS